MKQLSISVSKASTEKVKKCGNCSHLKPMGKNAEDLPQVKELSFGKCEIANKRMSGSLIAGCFYWIKR